MTELIITPNYDKKTARFKGTIAGGESVKVTIVGAAKWFSSGLRLRVVCGCTRTVAMFPLKSEDGTVSSFEVVGDDLIAAPLELNTIQARLYTQGFATTAATFIVEDLEKNILYFQDSYELHGWVKRDGDEEPYDLTKFPELIEDWRKQIENLIVDAKEVDGGIEVTICDGVSPAKTFIIRNGRDGQPGEPGRKGDDGKSLKFSDLTEAQKAELKGPKGDTGEGITDELKALPNKVTENAQAIGANRVAINTEENRAKGAEKELLTRIEDSKANAAAAMTAASKAQDTADKTVVEIATLVGDDAGDKRKSARQIAAEEVAKVIAGADTNYDTLKEIADYIKGDAVDAAQLKNKVTNLEANKADKTEVAALDERVTELEEISINPSYRLIDLPAGETQLQNRTSTHITEANITKEWSASCNEWDDETGTDIRHEATNVDWIKKESHPFIYDGQESFVARFPWLPGFLFPIVPVSEVIPGEAYYFGDMMDENGNLKYSLFDKVEFTVKSITSQSLSYNNTIPQVGFVMTSEETGDEFRGVFTDFNFAFYDELYDGEIMQGLDVFEYNVSFENDLVPPEVAEHPDGYWLFDLEGLENGLPKPGDTISCIAYWADWDAGFEGPRYRVNMTFPEDMPDYTLSYAEKIAKASCKATIKNGDSQTELDLGDVTVNWGKEDEEQWDEETGDYVYIPRTFISIYDSVYTLQIGVSLDFNVLESKYGSEMEDPSDFDIGRKVTINALDVDADNFYSGLDSTLRISDHFKFLPPEPDKHGNARDLLLCVDLSADRQIELPGVTEAEEGLFELAAGRTLISITEPVAGELYASTRQLPTENA